jgi:hypothetical protein
MALRPCLDCHRWAAPGDSRCPGHKRQQSRLRDQRRPGTAARGYGSAHQRIRQAAVAAYHPADLCSRCGEALGLNPDLLDLGHTDDRGGYEGLQHRECNRGQRR